MTRETKLLFDNVMREDRNITELLTANYTFVDEVLAKHYGIPNVQGTRFRRVALDRSEPVRTARSGQHSHADLARQSHVAGAARQVRDGSLARRRAAAAARRSCRR